MLSPFLYSLVILKSSWKKTHIEKNIFIIAFVNEVTSGIIGGPIILGEQNRNPPNCTVLGNGVFENFVLAL